METTKYLEKLAEQGDLDAIYRLGHRIAYGGNRPRPTDWHAAFKLWERAAIQGEYRSMYCLARCYEFGQGVLPNIQTAIEWYTRAA